MSHRESTSLLYLGTVAGSSLTMIRERQYKRRFAKWGLDTKNIRDHDMRLALAKDLKRKRKGKDTEFEINGRLLPRQKMQRFMARKELSEEDVIRSDARKSTSTSSRVPLLNMKATPPYVTYHTPRPVENDDVGTRGRLGRRRCRSRCARI